jgi:hypothetical protein
MSHCGGQCPKDPYYGNPKDGERNTNATIRLAMTSVSACPLRRITSSTTLGIGQDPLSLSAFVGPLSRLRDHTERYRRNRLAESTFPLTPIWRMWNWPSGSGNRNTEPARVSATSSRAVSDGSETHFSISKVEMCNPSSIADIVDSDVFINPAAAGWN